jgi:GDP-L-fucose synthase
MTEAPILFPLRGRRIFVAGHSGMVGSAILRRLEARGETSGLLTADRGELDLSRQAEVEAWFERHRPEAVFLAAAKVGGILANATRPADFIAENLAIELNVVAAAHRTGVRKLLFLGSSCIYPRLAPQPIPETALLTGELEPTNEWYAVAKIAGMKLCEAYRRQHGADFISVMPTNLYGTNDNFDLQSSHVLPALIAKAHNAKRTGAATLEVWGTGSPRREFLHVDDLADACLHLMERYSAPEPVNIGTGEDLSIRELAELICRVVGFRGTLVFDTGKPDGTPRKLLDVSRLHALGWRHRIPLEEGVRQTYRWYLEQEEAAPLVS